VGGGYDWGSVANFSSGSDLFMKEACRFPVAVFILSAGVRNPLGGPPELTSHSDAIGVAGCTFVRRGTWVLMRCLPVVMWCPTWFGPLSDVIDKLTIPSKEC